MPIQQNSDIHSWYQLINKAKTECGYDFSTGLDHYLVLTLKAFIDKTDIATNVLALSYLESMQNKTSHRSAQRIRYVGDQCLLLSGLFPERAKKCNVSLGYYVDLGKNAYMALAQAQPYLKLNNELFYELGLHFVGLMDVLNAIRYN